MQLSVSMVLNGDKATTKTKNDNDDNDDILFKWQFTDVVKSMRVFVCVTCYFCGFNLLSEVLHWRDECMSVVYIVYILSKSMGLNARD